MLGLFYFTKPNPNLDKRDYKGKEEIYWSVIQRYELHMEKGCAT